jgi:hypothetical protein
MSHYSCKRCGLQYYDCKCAEDAPDPPTLDIADAASRRPPLRTYDPETHFLQPKISGYRQLSADEVALINEVKALSERCGELVAKLRQRDQPYGFTHGTEVLDQRWISIGATDLQRGFMAIVRGIARPEGF